MKKLLILMTISVLLLSLMGCNTETNINRGSITLSIKDTLSRTITSGISLKAERYLVVGTGPESSSVSFELSDENSSWTKSDVIAGVWEFSVSAYNSNNIQIGEGRTRVVVFADKNTSVTIIVNEIADKGQLTVRLSGITQDSVKYHAYICVPDGGDSYSYKREAEMNNGEATFELENGWYFIQITCDNTDVILPAPEAVRILAGDNLTASFTVCDHGSISTIISNGIIPNPTMNISLNKNSVYVGDQITATASINVNDSFTYEWYVDDVKQRENNESSIDISFALDGIHTISCTALSLNSSVVWSQKIEIDVTNPPIQVSFYNGNRMIERIQCESGKPHSFPEVTLGDGFTLEGWTLEGNTEVITSDTFSLPYSETEYKYYAYITTDLLTINESGVVRGTDELKNSDTITTLNIPDSINGITVACKRSFG